MSYISTEKSNSNQPLVKQFRKALEAREKRLPKQTVHDYICSFLNEKEVFLESAMRFGSPQYFFHAAALTERALKFREIFSKYLCRIKTFYAMKSNSFPGICKNVIESGFGLDVSSGLELSKALELGCEQIIFSGPGKTDDELELALNNRKRVTILMDSEGELERISRLVKREGSETKLAVGVRISSVSQKSWNKFGVPLKTLPRILTVALQKKNIQIQGIQFHTSWNLNPDAQVAMIKEIGKFLKKHAPENFWKGGFRFIDIGGGYWPEQGEWLHPENTLKGSLIRLLDPSFKFRSGYYYRKALPLEVFADRISKAIVEAGPPLSLAEIWCEPGRWISTPAMHILLKVVDIKGKNVAITDGGTNLLGWERPLTEFIPVINLSQPAVKPLPFRIFGSLCTPLDIWGTAVYGKNVSAGDILLIPDQGAYTYSLRQTFIKPVANVIHYNGKALKISEYAD